MLDRMTRQFFAAHVNETFYITTPSGERAEVSLVEVTGREDEYTESFSLMFRGSRQMLVEQDTHAVSHDELGTFPLFVGPVHTGKTDAVYYQAVFNRLKHQ